MYNFFLKTWVIILLCQAPYNNIDPLPLKILKGLELWSKNNPIEKVFLHTDKSIYLAGESIWYKAYLNMDAEPSYLSKIIYIDLVDEKGKVVDKQMRPVVKGNTSGDLILPKDLPTGNYSINAYSLWMLNFPRFVFKKNVRIYNYDHKQPEQGKLNKDFSLQFFPEGGELIETLNNKVGFYAVSAQGLPIHLEGKITNQSGKTITAFSTEHSGYGKLEITPEPGELLTATVEHNNITKTFLLPTPKKEGILLKVNNANPNMTFVKVERHVTGNVSFNNIVVVAQIHGKLAFIGMVNFEENATGMAIPKKNLPPGILHITAFDTSGVPLAERLAFVNNYDLPSLNLITDSISTRPKEINKYKINLSQFSNPSVSVSVTDAEFSTIPETEDNIISNLLLTSDLKGYIHQPGYYFKNKSEKVTAHLDLLMLTHGWRRFNWQEVISQKDIPLVFPVETSISVSGKITIPESKKTIAGGHVDIITKGEDSTTILSKVIINDKGGFYLNDLNFQQKATLYFQGSKVANQNAKVDVIVNKAYIDTLNKSPNVATIDADTLTATGFKPNPMLDFISKQVAGNKVYTLAGVTVTTRKISRIDSLNLNYASPLFQLGQSLEPTALHYLNIWQFLREQVAGLTVEGDINDPSVSFSRFAGLGSSMPPADEGIGVNGEGGIAFFLNEISVPKDVINTVHPTDIALVKVMKGPESANLGASEGIIAIYTKKGGSSAARPAEKGFFIEKKLGYAVKREFFNPAYNITNASNVDNRTTLYWNANVKKDESGFGLIKFFNNDFSKSFKVTVQGIDQTGKMLYKEIIVK